VQAAGLVLAAGCAVLLVVEATDGVRTTDALSSPAAVEQAAAQDSYYNCLSEHAMKLVPTGATVAVSALSGGVDDSARLSAIVGWADIAPASQSASVVLALTSGYGAGSCDGVVVVQVGGASQ
jgi:hypothetical protein